MQYVTNGDSVHLRNSRRAGGRYREVLAYPMYAWEIMIAGHLNRLILQMCIVVLIQFDKLV